MAKSYNKLTSRIAFFATIFAFIVVILGAYTRLKEAGLGCPDWPGCYGQLVVPNSQQAMASAQKLYPHQPIEAAKAWAEMVHRYFAFTLVMLVATLVFKSAFHRISSPNARHPIKIPFLLLGCIIFQALLGMWTVTLQLLPLVVMGHLLGGMTIAGLLWWLTLDSGQWVSCPSDSSLAYLRPWVLIGVAIVFIQIFLGGWTTANYASIVCPDFPYCQGRLFPSFHLSEAFNFMSPIGRNYQGGVLNTAARITIQMTHRYGAFVTLTYLSLLGSYILFSKKTYVLKNTIGMVFIILGTQVFLGILNIATQLSLPIAVSHNAVALLLLLSMVTLFYQLKPITQKRITVLSTKQTLPLQGEFFS